MMILIFIVLFFVFFYIVLRSKNIHIWFWSYLRQSAAVKPPIKNGPLKIVFCIVDHFEPRWKGVDYETEARRVDDWVAGYPKLADRHRDSNGRKPQYTFFYPEEEYRKEHLDKLAMLCKQGYGDVEIHLHHDNDTSEGLQAKISSFKSTLKSHGLLSLDKKGNITYGFIHGNWALDNSRKDGKWCGVNNELSVLKETGCYADFTLPSAPSDTQTRKINSIYYATDNPDKPKSHNDGIDVEAGKAPSGDLMIIQGPLSLNWHSRKWGLFPRIENGEITGNNPPTPDRIDLWVKQNIHVKGAPNWVFVKVHTHGCQESNSKVLLGDMMDDAFEYLEKKYNDGKRYKLHYVSARKMYDKIKSLENSQDID